MEWRLKIKSKESISKPSERTKELTDKERKIWRLWEAGFLDDEIADFLGISEEEVKSILEG